MSISASNILEKTVLLGLSYFNAQGDEIKQNLLAGTVTAVDEENGITLALIGGEAKAQFILPFNLNCWFVAPRGSYSLPNSQEKITDPDFLVTWDIHQSKADKREGEQQWWEWVPRVAAPRVGQESKS